MNRISSYRYVQANQGRASGESSRGLALVIAILFAAVSLVSFAIDQKVRICSIEPPVRSAGG